MPNPAGWYDDPEMANTRRYWDGEAWTEHRQEKSAAAPPVYVQQSEEPTPVAVGWGVAFAILVPIVGFFIGLALVGKRGNDGIKIVVVSVVCFLLWFWVVSAVVAEDAPPTACELNNSQRAGDMRPPLPCD